MKKIYFILFSLLFLTQINAQEKHPSKLDLIQGIWENTMNGDIEHSYKIIKGMNSLGFSYTNDPNQLDFYLMESKEGFQNINYIDFDSININSFKENGEYFTTIINKKYIKNGWVRKKYCIVPDYFECDGENMSINGGQLAEYSKIKRLPSPALKMLYNRGKIDKRDYIKEYLGIKVGEIKVDKAIIYSEPGTATKMYLLKDDVVTILEIKDNWIKIEFLGTKLVQGWIMKKDVS